MVIEIKPLLKNFYFLKTDLKMEAFQLGEPVLPIKKDKKRIIEICGVLDFGLLPHQVDPSLIVNVAIKMATENVDTTVYEILNFLV